MRAVPGGVLPRTSNPALHDPSVLAQGEVRPGFPAREEVITGPELSACDPCRQRLAGRFSNLKLHRPLRLALHDDCPRGDAASQEYVPHCQANEIAPTQL